MGENEKNRAEEEELQMLRDMLWSEELGAARRREEAERKERLEAQKAEMALANEQMLAAKKKQEAVDAAEEGKLVQLMLEKFAQDAEEDRLAEVKRIERREKYKSEIETQKNERLQMYVCRPCLQRVSARLCLRSSARIWPRIRFEREKA